jgi:RNA polymerase sigma-70 factor (ECF subfamily)
MNNESLEPLLAKLGEGDLSAARQVFMACEAPLRKMVRRQLPNRLRSKFDSADVVQSVWATLINGFRAQAWRFSNVEQLQAFLVQVTRNRFHDKCRKHKTALEKEQALGGLHTSEMPSAPQAHATAIAEAAELWERLLKLCAPEHQEMLQLKREGLPMDEIVQRTGLHPGSIRRILRNLAGKLALQEASLS